MRLHLANNIVAKLLAEDLVARDARTPRLFRIFSKGACVLSPGTRVIREQIRKGEFTKVNEARSVEWTVCVLVHLQPSMN